MPQYYGVARSSEYLAHYGVKGMKWGVRKAIERNDSKMLDRQYKKASKKLKKLSFKADVKAQKAIADKMGKVSKISSRIGMAGVGTMLGSVGANTALLKAANNTYLKRKLHASRYNEFANQMLGHKDRRALKALMEARNNGTTDQVARNLIDDYNTYNDYHFNLAKATDEKLKNKFNNQLAGARLSRRVGNVASIIGGTGLGLAAGSALIARNARKRTTKEGHAKAVAKRNIWQQEMDKSFAGTKYDRRRKNRRNV